MRPTAALALLVALMFSSAARAQTVAEFYRGKTIDIIVGAGAGGGYDVNARLLARHLGRHTPGAPAFVVSNMPGGGGIAATNFLANVAPRDGTRLATFSNAMLTEPLFGANAVKFDPTRFEWIGSLAREEGICIASRASGVRSLADLAGRRLVVGSTAPGTTTYLFPMLLQRLFGYDFKLVSGYADGGQVVLALERGEIDMLCQTWSSLRILHPDWVARGFVAPLVWMGLATSPDFPGVPAIMELAKDDERRLILRAVLAPTAAGRPFAAPPGAPADRVAALRSAFVATTSDSSFLEDARKTGVDVAPLEGRAIDDLLREIYAAPPALIARVRALVSATETR